MRGKREIRTDAKGAVYALLDVSLDNDDSDLFVGTEDYTEEEREEFVAEVYRIMKRVWP